MIEQRDLARGDVVLGPGCERKASHAQQRSADQEGSESALRRFGYGESRGAKVFAHEFPSLVDAAAEEELLRSLSAELAARISPHELCCVPVRLRGFYAAACVRERQRQARKKLLLVASGRELERPAEQAGGTVERQRLLRLFRGDDGELSRAVPIPAASW
jgi:hypothetical protein